MKVLIAEDDSVVRRAIEIVLRKRGYQVIMAENGRKAWEALDDREIRLAIIDRMMPEMTGIEVCEKIRRRTGEYVFVIILSAQDSESDIVSGLDAGADDYVTKPFSQKELQARLRAGERIVRLENDLLAAQQKIETMATQDELTSLWNRRAIIQRLHEELARARREGFPVAVGMVDVDHFKRVNDTLGHGAGDRVLVEVARRMVLVSRAYDSVGRYGGDEFLLVLANTDREQAERIGRRICETVRQAPVDTAGGPVNVSITLGIATMTTTDEAAAEELISVADRALYDAKERGRDQMAVRESGDGHQQQKP